MTEQKIFAGPRIRRIRNGLNLTQSAMAKELGISASYLNLIERNQRPLTVQLLFKLTSTYSLNLEELQGESSGAVTDLQGVFGDPLLAGEIPDYQELFEVADAAPNATNGILKLYQAYQESQSRLTDLKNLLADDGRDTALLAAQLPADEVRRALEERPNYYPLIEAKAAALHDQLGSGLDMMTKLANWMEVTHKIAIRMLPLDVMPNAIRQFDKHTMRLFISERLSHADRTLEVAKEAALLFLSNELDQSVDGLGLSSEEAQRIARFELARYAALAIMMPYDTFYRRALRSGYDVDTLMGSFSASFELVALRLTSLKQPGKAGIPFFVLEVDCAGNQLRHLGADGFPAKEFGGKCPRLPAYTTLSTTDKMSCELAVLPNERKYLLISAPAEGPKPAFGERQRRTAVMLGCLAEVGTDSVYAKRLAAANAEATPIGPSCRLCERKGCLSRAEPPITKPVGLDEMVTGLSVFDFQ